MDGKKLSIGEAVKFGWAIMKDHIGFFLGLLTVAFLIENLPAIIANFVREALPFISVTLYFASWVLGFVVQMGLIKIGLKFCDGIKGQLDDLLSSFNLLLTFIASSLVYALIMLGGFILFIVPGVIWGVKFSLYSYFIVDKGLGPLEALKASGKATEGAKWDLFLLGGLLGLINLAGALFLLVGLFATIPTSLTAYAYAYRKLTGQAEGPKNVMYVNLGI
ncbi:MAG: hypothetical protein HZA14_12855 [Nitrospirae bacterium]|nr:hypothetical protein [Nitrospirota bacterium]